MKKIKSRMIFCATLIGALCIWNTSVHAQAKVDVNINISEYDVLFLTDFFNVKSQRLGSNISNFSVDLDVQPPASLRVCVEVLVQVKLHGDASFQQPPLVQGISSDFDILNGHRTLTAIDFTGNGVANANVGKYYKQNLDTKRKIAELAQATSTAPPGTYQVTMIVHPAGATNIGGSVIGKDTKTIVIPYSSVDEVFVEINDPKNGSYFTNLAPTFSWTTSEKEVRVSVYEAGTNHHSPQDVLTGGNPCLVWDSFNENINRTTPGLTSLTANSNLQSQQKAAGVNGTSLTYPSNAQRQLQEDKAYVLQVEARVFTNRGPIMRPSRPVVFRISDDKIGQMLDNFVNVLSNDKLSSSYSSIRSDPSNWIFWSSYGDITLDGVKQTGTDLQAILKDLANRSDLKIDLDIENQ